MNVQMEADIVVDTGAEDVVADSRTIAEETRKTLRKSHEAPVPVTVMDEGIKNTRTTYFDILELETTKMKQKCSLLGEEDRDEVVEDVEIINDRVCLQSEPIPDKFFEPLLFMSRKLPSACNFSPLVLSFTR